MEVIADLHVHSHFSVATGREADLEHLDLWGRYKGVGVVGTGDCTHPVWLQEMAEKLEPAGEGVYCLKPGLGLPLEVQGPRWAAAAPVRFVITGEVSTIYKKGGRVRKVHLLLLLPGLEAAERLSARLGRLGNVKSDGRPILGLDAKSLLEVVLEAAPGALVIPAHIWTPWFSVLGSKSGFDSLAECFEDALTHIYALETGLSSDPAMNWRVRGLDSYLLVSNSDAHSPQKLGREANIFLVPPSYPDLVRAIQTKEGFGGTLEFFPQEGKYHLDGHRKCGLRLAPEEAAGLQGICPWCGRPLTEGVMHRVLDLADRAAGERPPGAKPFESLIALPEVLAEVLGVGAGSKAVKSRYFRLLERLGPELAILRRAAPEDLAREGGALLAHAVAKMRRGEVYIAPGYDGEYGEIHLISPEERSRFQGQAAFFSPAPNICGPVKVCENSEGWEKTAAALAMEEVFPPETSGGLGDDPLLASLNAAQAEVVRHRGAPLLVQAGPGTGKTRALTHRLAYLLARQEVEPSRVLALTFTRQAAGEMESRLHALLPGFPGLDRLTVATFHALGHRMLLAQDAPAREVADEERRRRLLRQVARDLKVSAATLEKQITRWKQALTYPGELEEDGPLAAGFRAYETALAREGLWDFEDLIALPVRLLRADAAIRGRWRGRFGHLLVDEYQDLNEAQYQLFQTLAGSGAEILAIGDPDQAIYGFRGASPAYFERFCRDWPGARVISFPETYRLPRPVLQAAQYLRNAGDAAPLKTWRAGDRPVVLLEEATADAEARAIAKEIERLVGGLSHRGLEDAGLRYEDRVEERAGFKDIAVLYRVHALGPELERALSEAGIPCLQAREGVGPDWDGIDLAAERVKLLTLHAAKGLEFPYVFIAGCEEGLIPWEPPGENAADPAEERRLLYVGLTRASRQVFLTRARQRSLGGQRRRTSLSSLLQSLPAHLLTRPGPGRPRRTRQLTLFSGAGPPGTKRT